MSTVGKIIGTTSIVGGLVGAAIFGGVAARKRNVRLQRAASMGETPLYDTLVADRSYSVNTEDGVALRVEEVGSPHAGLTVIFSHGWTLRMGAWHYQRIGLAGRGFGSGAGAAARLVFYDQRSHGASSRAASNHVAMADLVGDLRAVIETAAPKGPIVIIGHSMGGMATLGLAAASPELFAERVVGVALVSTTAGRGPAALATMAKVLGSATTRWPTVLERGRSSTKDAVWELTRLLGFARNDVPPALVDYLDEMISGTSLEVIAEFAPTILNSDNEGALGLLADLPVLILCGDHDRITPLGRSRAMAEALPNAELVVVQGAGHMVILECPDLVNDALRSLLRRAAAFARRRAQAAGA